MPKICAKKTIYRLTDRVAGVIDREWHATKPAGTVAGSTTAAGRAFRLCHDFSLPPTTTSVNQNLNLNDTDNTVSELDIQVVDTVIDLTLSATDVWLQFQGGSEGYWAIEAGFCCGPLQLMAELGYQDRIDNLAIVGPVRLPKGGQHKIRAWNIDTGGTNSSHTATYSTDGVNFSSALPAGVFLNQMERTEECRRIPECDPLPEGWFDLPIKRCLSPVVDPLPDPVLNDLVLTPEQVQEIIKDARPDPIDVLPVAWGNATLVQAIIVDRWREPCGFSLSIRARVQQPSGTGWGGLNILPIAGFQQPQIFPVNGYHPSSSPTQIDDPTGQGLTGASPRGPFMTATFGHWSSTRRLYGFFRRDNAIDEYWEFIVRYLEA